MALAQAALLAATGAAAMTAAEDDEKEYVVEKILAVRPSQTKCRQDLECQIKWRGYPVDQPMHLGAIGSFEKLQSAFERIQIKAKVSVKITFTICMTGGTSMSCSKAKSWPVRRRFFTDRLREAYDFYSDENGPFGFGLCCRNENIKWKKSMSPALRLKTVFHCANF